MNTSNNPGEKLAPNPVFRMSSDILIWAIIALQILISIGAFPFLPAIVPTHWNAAGQVNGHASKWVNTLIFPLLSIALYVLIRGLMALGPRLGRRENSVTNERLTTIILAAVFLFLLILQVSITAISLGLQIDITFITTLAVSLLFILIGNYLGKIRRNFWMGIRTPWTLTSEVVWERTHRVGGWLFVAAGLIGILFSFVPMVRLWGIIVLIIAISIFLYIYSYLCYRQQEQKGDEPLSPPFAGDNS